MVRYVPKKFRRGSSWLTGVFFVVPVLRITFVTNVPTYLTNILSLPRYFFGTFLATGFDFATGLSKAIHANSIGTFSEIPVFLPSVVRAVTQTPS